MKKQTVKILSAVLGAAVLCTGVGAASYSAGAARTNPAPVSAASDADSMGNASGTSLYKDETVYVIAGADGSVEKVIVSDWIKNGEKNQSIADYSELSDVENVKGDETYTMNGDHMRVWDAQGNDIYYQGITNKELPVNLSVQYLLDGKAISPEELAGKSGRVTIRFNYENTQYETVEIDGAEEKIYVPFAMLTGTILDNDHFSNITVTNGKLINDGDRTIVAGIAFPGLSDNLALSDDTFKIPDYIEISADVTNFGLTTTLTLATNEVFSSIDLSDADSLDDLKDSLNKLDDAMAQLLDGSSRLYSGLSELLDKSGELISGVDQLAAGAKQLADGSAQLDAGASKLYTGAAALSGGLSELAQNNDSLNAGAEQIFESILAAADTQLAAAGVTAPKLTIENYADVLNGVVSSLDEETIYQTAYQTAYTQVSETVRQNESAIRTGVTAAVKKQVTGQVLSAAGLNMTAEQYEAAVQAGQISEQVQAQISAAVSAQMASEQVQTSIDQNTEQQIQTLIDQNMQSDEVKAKIEAAVEQAKTGVSSVTALKAQLDGINQFYTGLSAYTAGVAQAKDGSDALLSGTKGLSGGTASLKEGSQTLYQGVMQLKNGSGALTEGVSQLKSGAMQLSDGLKTFNEQGVQRIVEAAGGELGSVVTRLRATCDVSKNYKSFSGIGGDMDGQVKFIYRTEAIKAEDTKKGQED